MPATRKESPLTQRIRKELSPKNDILPIYWNQTVNLSETTRNNKNFGIGETSVPKIPDKVSGVKMTLSSSPLCCQRIKFSWGEFPV